MKFTSILQKQHLQKGIGLLELMLALAIIALLIIMATRYYQTTKETQRVADAMTQVSTIAGAVGNWSVGKSSTAGLIWDELKGQGLIPPEMYDRNTANPWGTSMDVWSGGGKAWGMGMFGIPSAACLVLMDRYKNTAGVTASCSPPTEFRYIVQPSS